MEIQEWLDRSLSHLKRVPEREALRRELYDHYADHLDVLLARGIPLEKAMPQAVAALGDPRETGLLLRRVHRPWLTWALRLTWVLIALALLMLLFHTSDVLGFLDNHILFQKDAFAGFQNVDRMGEGLTKGAWRSGTCDKTVAMGEYRISVAGAGSCFAQEGYFPPMTAPAHPSLTYVMVRFLGPPWRRPDEDALKQAVWVEDNLGCIYRIQDDLDLPELPEPVGLLRCEGRLSSWKIHQNWFSTYYVFWFDDMFNASFSAADSMELHIRRGGKEVVLPIRFGEWNMKGFPVCSSEEEVVDNLSQMERTWSEKYTAVSAEAEGYRATVPKAGFSGYRLWMILTLQGDPQHLPMTETELLSTITLTDENGIRCLQQISIKRLGDSFDWNQTAYVEGISLYDGFCAYLISIQINSNSAYYDLCCTLDGTAIPLRIVTDREETE